MHLLTSKARQGW